MGGGLLRLVRQVAELALEQACSKLMGIPGEAEWATQRAIRAEQRAAAAEEEARQLLTAVLEALDGRTYWAVRQPLLRVLEQPTVRVGFGSASAAVAARSGSTPDRVLLGKRHTSW